MYPAISTEDLLNIPIALPKESTRQKITQKVRASHKTWEQSKQLLEIAKTAVERAIYNSLVLKMTVYAKSEQVDIAAEDIQSIITEYEQQTINDEEDI
ncbi:hypothetical protein [Nostoc sp.]|uniref:hypothetical protein n=1 Tax=Nostoc sp. TaxID=1180 RepID=UPI002FFB5466